MQIINRRRRVFAYFLNFFLFVITLPFRLFRKRKVANLESPKILVSRPDRLGDVLLSTPVFHSLKEKFPNSKIVMLCYPAAESLMKYNPYVDEILLVECPWWEKNKGFKDYLHFFKICAQIIRKVNAEKFDIFIELRGDIRLTFIFGWIPNIAMRISNDRSKGTFLLTHVKKFNFDLHEIEKNNDLLSFFDPINKYHKTEVYTNNISVALTEHAIDEDYIIIFNGGRSPLRRLEEDKIVEIVNYIYKKHGLQCIMVGDNNDAQLASNVVNKVEDSDAVANLCGKLSLLEVKDLISRARLFIGTDSSINHIAASTNIPSISLFGPMLPSQVRQLGDEKHFIFHNYACAPCLQQKCIVTGSDAKAACMNVISSSEILLLAEHLLNKSVQANKVIAY